MAVSKAHKRVSKHLRVGDDLVQPYGEPIQIADTLTPGTTIKGGLAKGRRPDHRVMTTENVPIAVEYRYTSSVPLEKRRELAAAGIPTLEIDMRPLGFEPSDAEIKSWVSGPRQEMKWVAMPSICDLVERQAEGRIVNGVVEDFGRIRCLFRGCRRAIVYGCGGVFIDPQLGLDGSAASYDKIVADQFQLKTKFTLPRFACHQHSSHALVASTPGGRDWYKTPGEPNTYRVVFAHSGH